MGAPKSVWVIDDEKEFRELLEAGLRLESCFAVRAFCSADEAFLELRTLSDHPDVILLDIQMPGTSGLRAIDHFRKLAPSARILMTTASGSIPNIETALRAGAFGYVQKTAGLKETVRAVHAAVAGTRHLDGRSLSCLLNDKYGRSAQSHALNGLTGKEEQVLSLLRRGLGRKEIAEMLDVSDETVKSHIKAIYAKLGVHKSTEAVRRAIENGLL